MGRALGVTGFPAVFARIDGRLSVLARGAEPHAAVERRLRTLLSG